MDLAEGIPRAPRDTTDRLGYSWLGVASAPIVAHDVVVTPTVISDLTITKEGFADSEPTDGMVGTPGRQWWIVRGDSPGEAVLQLRYLRPWEDDASPARRAAITVNVRQ